MKSKLEAMKRLRRAQMFVLITEESSLMVGDFNENLDGFLIIDAMKEVRTELDNLITQAEAVHGRNTIGRPTSRPKKSGK